MMASDDKRLTRTEIEAMRPLFSPWMACSCGIIPHAEQCPRVSIPMEILEALDAGRRLLKHAEVTAKQEPLIAHKPVETEWWIRDEYGWHD